MITAPLLWRPCECLAEERPRASVALNPGAAPASLCTMGKKLQALLMLVMPLTSQHEAARAEVAAVVGRCDGLERDQAR